MARAKGADKFRHGGFSLVAAASATGFGYASSRLIEKPFLSLKRGLSSGLRQTSNSTASVN
jgi:hypothetical protein